MRLAKAGNPYGREDLHLFILINSDQLLKLKIYFYKTRRSTVMNLTPLSKASLARVLFT
jgi:hypothetical protein